MTKRIFRSVCLAAVSVLAASVILFLYALYDYFSDTQQAQLRIQTDLVSQGVDLVGKSYFEGLDTSKYRITRLCQSIWNYNRILVSIWW